MPDAQCTRSLACKVESTRVSHHRYSRIHPAFPHAMVLTVSFVLSPVIGLSCHRHRRVAVPQVSALVFSPARVPRIPPRVRDVRTPLEWGRTVGISELIWVRREAEYF